MVFLHYLARNDPLIFTVLLTKILQFREKKPKCTCWFSQGCFQGTFLLYILMWKSVEHNALKVQAALSWDALIPRALGIYLLSVYITDKLIRFAAIWNPLNVMVCFGWVGGLTFHLENKPRNKLMEKQEDGTKKKKRIRKTKGVDSSISPVLLPTEL